MGQLSALIYKNYKLQSKNLCSTIFQIFLPLIVVIIVYLLQIVAKDLSEKSKPPIDLPVSSINPINIPYQEEFKIVFNVTSCIKSQKYGYKPEASDQTKLFFEEKLNFNNQNPTFRYKKCELKEPIYSPYFNLTNLNSVDKMSDEILDDVEQTVSFTLDQKNVTPIPPDGAFLISEGSDSKIKATLMANNFNNVFYHRINGQTLIQIQNLMIGIPTEGYMNLIDFISNNYLNQLNNNDDLIRQILTIGGSLSIKQPIFNLFLRLFEIFNIFFYPLALCMGFPIIMQFLVMEKEENVTHLMEVNGMKRSNYYLSNAIFFLIFFSLSWIIFFVSGYFFLDDGFFHRISFFEIGLLCLLWNLNQVFLSNFVCIFIDSSGMAIAAGYFISIIGNLFFLNVCCNIYPFPGKLPFAYRIFPNCTLTRIILYLMLKGDMVFDPNADNENFWNYISLVMTAVIYLLLTLIINEIEFVQKIFSCSKKFQNKTDNLIHQTAEEEKNISEQDAKDYAVSCLGISKTFIKNGLPFQALSDFWVSIKKGEIFGLLGPNGAGKTTFISIVTGFLESDSGKLFLEGEELNKTNWKSEKISLCPQFDLLWPTLTVYEHFKIFGMLRGLMHSELQKVVEQIIERVKLTAFSDLQVQYLSGGMKRRCSLGIALMGNINLVFLDEPTTGLDPKRRREIWEIIQQSKSDKTFILSTHLMEEAEFLCDRIGLIHNGSLRALGKSAFLKKSFSDWVIVELIFKKHSDLENGTKRIVSELKGEITQSSDSK